MAKASFQLDPGAVAYTDDEIVGKINSATADITRADSVSTGARPIVAGEIGATELEDEAFTTAEQSKLTGIEDSATTDQTGTEVRDVILGLADTDRKIVITDPTTGEFPILSIQRDSTGKLDIDYDDVATT